LYSDAVEELGKSDTRSSATSNMPAAGPHMRRGSKFGDLVKSIQQFPRRFSRGSCSSIESYHPLSSSASTSGDRNLAPRRLSFNNSMESSHSPSMISLAEFEMEDPQDLDNNHTDSFLSKDDETSGQHFVSRKAHLILREVDLDPLETIFKTKIKDERESNLEDSSSTDSFFFERADEFECGWLPWPKEQTNGMDDDSHGGEDDHGWLPWPQEEVDN
jgi:hypothetical protein